MRCKEPAALPPELPPATTFRSCKDKDKYKDKAKENDKNKGKDKCLANTTRKGRISQSYREKD